MIEKMLRSKYNNGSFFLEAATLRVGILVCIFYRWRNWGSETFKDTSLHWSPDFGISLGFKECFQLYDSLPPLPALTLLPVFEAKILIEKGQFMGSMFHAIYFVNFTIKSWQIKLLAYLYFWQFYSSQLFEMTWFSSHYALTFRW